MAPTYTGYLAPHLDLILDGHARGLGTRAIAERLYALGVRASTSDGETSSRTLSPQEHLGNLQTMTGYVLLRVGLRQRHARRSRQLTARRRTARDGTVT